MNWLHNGKEVTEDMVPDGAIGFVYVITHIPTNRFYIGKKSLTAVRRLKPLKGKVRKRVVRKASDWEKYYSSNEWIKEQIKAGKEEEFKREIIEFCYSKKTLSYLEVYYQYKHNVLTDENSINENILGKFFRRDILNKPKL